MDPVASDPIRPLSNFTPQSDSSKYIRTYAKDVAALSGTISAQKPTPSSARSSASPQAPVEAHGLLDNGVSLPDYDSSPVNQADGASPKEFDQETIELNSSDSEGIFAHSASAAPEVSIPKQTPPPTYASLTPPPAPIPTRFPTPVPTSEPLPAPEPTPEPTFVPTPVPEPLPVADVVSVPVPTLEPGPTAVAETLSSTIPAPAPTPAPAPVPAIDAERESILARLRSKMAAQKQATPVAEPVTPPGPAPTSPEEPALRAGAPDFSTAPEPVLPMPPVVTESAYTPAPARSLPDTPSPIHTYSSDFADHIDSEQSSTFSVLAAQSDAAPTPRAKPHRSALVPLLAGFVMLLIGAGAIGGAYLFTKHGSITPVATKVPSLIQYDESVNVTGTGAALMGAISTVAQGGSVSGNVVVTYVTLATTTGSGIPQPGGVLIKQMGLPAPDILLRNLDQMSTVGVIRAGTESRPFMILKVNSYERTFAGMLAWEPTMAADLSIFYPAYADVPAVSVGTTTIATSSPDTFDQPTPRTFTDGVVANYDVRILRDASGRSLLVYGYRGKDTLIIARDEAAFTSLISRLTAAGD